MADGINLGDRRPRARSIGRPETFYPSPFFDIAQNYIPRSVKDTFDWCQFYQLTNPLISNVTNKMATYAITDLVYDDENEGVVAEYRGLFEKQFRLRTFLVETNLDRFTYGNAFVSVSFPFIKMLQCQHCGVSKEASKLKYQFRGFKFVVDCKDCGQSGAAIARDEPVKNRMKIQLIRWNPKNISLKHNELTGETKYYYSMPRQIKNEIMLGKRDVLQQTPQAFIDALAAGKAISLDANKLFHARRPSVSRDPYDNGWGAPMLLPVLKDVFFLQVLRKAQEAVAMEHIVPMRTMFPQITADGNNPYAHINLKDWQKEVEGQIKTWRQDNNHIPVMPVPIGTQTIGGQGKGMLLFQELRAISDVIIAGMGVPTGFVYGEAMYSGANVNMRALENEFLGNRQDMIRLVEFIRDRVATFLDLPVIRLRFKPFKMADDMPRTQLLMQMSQAGLVSRRTLLQSMDYDYATELEIIQSEQLETQKNQRKQAIAQAETQGEVMLVSTKYQIEAQQEQQQAAAAAQPPPPPEGAPAQSPEQPPQEAPPTEAPPEAPAQPSGGAQVVDLFAEARKISTQLKKMDEVERYQALARIKNQNPDLYMLVNQAVAGGNGKDRPLQPLPEKLPPRAGAGRAQI